MITPRFRSKSSSRSLRLGKLSLTLELLENRRLLVCGPSIMAVTDDYSSLVEQADYATAVYQLESVRAGNSSGGDGEIEVDVFGPAIRRDGIVVSGYNALPRAEADFLEINHGETGAILSSQMLANDFDPDCGPLVLVGVVDANGGTAELRDGVVFFTPNDGEQPISFRYQVADLDGGVAIGTVHLDRRPAAHADMHDHSRAAEHVALFSLIDTASATNVAIRSGAWSDPSIWSSATVPAAGERVLIHETASVTYDVVNDEPLEWLRVDGNWNVAQQIPTRIVVETIVSNPRGTINVGTASQPINSEVVAEIVIDTSGGVMDQSADPRLIGRGFVSHGQTNIYGAPKLEFTTLATDVVAGSEFIEVVGSQPPEGWRVGDTLLLVGTEVDASLLNRSNQAALIAAADSTNSRFRDELLKITSMEVIGKRTRITFLNVTNDSAIAQGLTNLLWNHQRPEGATFERDELSIHVANLSRNIVVRSSDPTVDIQQRGHFMVMHNVNANIHHAQFKNLGRSDKRTVVDDPAVIGNFDGSPGFGTNARGRYGLHLHKLGAGSLTGPSAVVTGNVVWGTPGWGIVQHDSHAILKDNVVFDVVGAGIVAEDGNELGLWRNNLAVKITGDLVNNFDDNAFFQTPRGPRFDLGFFGSGYWVQGGGFGIRLEDNIAASTNAAGFDLVHNTDGLAMTVQIPTELIANTVVRQSIEGAGFDFVTPNNIPTRGIDGLQVYNGFRGVHTWLHNRDSDDMEGRFTFGTSLAHDFRSVVENYEIWGVQSGIQNFYSTRFDFIDGLVVGDVDQPIPYFADPEQQANNSEGIGVSHNFQDANSIAFRELRLEGFEYGFQVFSPFNDRQQAMSPYAISELRNAFIANVEHAFMPTNGSNPNSQTHRFSDLFLIDETSKFNTLGSSSNVTPVASFGYTSGDGRSIKLDASASFDSDPSPEVRAGDDGIVAYAWDLNGDGVFDDAYGLTVTLSVDSVGTYPIGLKVWDDDGAVDTTKQMVTISTREYDNPWENGDFSQAVPFAQQHYNIWSGRRGEGWIARDVVRNPAGFSEIGNPQWGLGGLAQLIRDEQVRRGQQTFSFRAINANVAGTTNGLRIRMFGVDGQWQLNGGVPSAIYAMRAPVVTTLVDVNLGSANIPNWQSQTFTVDFGKEGFEYLVLNVEYVHYDTSQGDYFALDDFRLVGPPSGASGGFENIRPTITMSQFPWIVPDRVPSEKPLTLVTAIQVNEIDSSSKLQKIPMVLIEPRRAAKTLAPGEKHGAAIAGSWWTLADSVFAQFDRFTILDQYPLIMH